MPKYARNLLASYQNINEANVINTKWSTSEITASNHPLNHHYTTQKHS